MACWRPNGRTVRSQALCRRPSARHTAGHYDRQLQTQAGEVTLNVPRLRSLPFETQIIERYRRRESSVEEALVEMYLAGVSVRRVEDITEALWARGSAQRGQRTQSEDLLPDRCLAQRPIEGRTPMCTWTASG